MGRRAAAAERLDARRVGHNGSVRRGGTRRFRGAVAAAARGHIHLRAFHERGRQLRRRAGPDRRRQPARAGRRQPVARARRCGCRCPSRPRSRCGCTTRRGGSCARCSTARRRRRPPRGHADLAGEPPSAFTARLSAGGTAVTRRLDACMEPPGCVKCPAHDHCVDFAGPVARTARRARQDASPRPRRSRPKRCPMLLKGRERRAARRDGTGKTLAYVCC